MKPRITIVHGIHTDDNANWMDYFVLRFREAGFAARKWTYGYAYALLTRWQNPGRARKLAALLHPGEIVLGHSNGGCLAWMAAELGARIGGAILLNPALDTDKVMAPHVPWVNLYANRHDDAVSIAGILPAHPWGPQGRDGIERFDERYRTVFSDNGLDSRPAPAVAGHSAILEPQVIDAWASRIIADTKARLEKQ